jgi:hypothetical protein
MNLWVNLAYQAIQTYLETGQLLPIPAGLPEHMLEPGAVFVSLHTGSGDLRGCRGTLTPTEPTLVEAVIKTAVASAVDDPRFPPITLGEMEGLDIHVDILSPLEPVTDVQLLDEKKYGVVIQARQGRAVLLPDIPVVRNVAHQLQLVRQKAGLAPDEPADLYYFTVTRYHADSK